VNTASCTAISSGKPVPKRPPTCEYSPSTFSRTTTRSKSCAARSGDSTPSNTRTGRRFTYWRNVRRMGISRPHSDTWSGTSGAPTAPSRIASAERTRSSPSAGIIAPSRRKRSHDQSYSAHSNSNP
jgi:hypothetical protein